MIVTTMNDIPGYEVEEVFGEVMGLTVRSRNIESVQRRERVEVGGVVAGRERSPQPALLEHLPHRRPLVRADGREHFEDLAAVARHKTLARGRLRDLVELAHRLLLVLPAPE